jgi:hypothetical protein
MARKKRWVESDIINGIGELRFHRWDYFVDYVQQEMLDFPYYIWRGHRRDDWDLQSTLNRLRVSTAPKFAKKKAKPSGYTEMSGHLERFKFAARGRRGPNPAQLTENEWWALAQHHGLATPLLDWTRSPFVAAYFAFLTERSPQTEYRAVWALHQQSVEKMAAQTLKEKKAEFDAAKPGSTGLASLASILPPTLEVEFIRPRSDENARLVTQDGLFSRVYGSQPLDQWVRAKFEKTQTYTVMKCLIPNTDRERCLRMLNRMNINHLTLFPDLDGAARFGNLSFEIAHY